MRDIDKKIDLMVSRVLWSSLGVDPDNDTYMPFDGGRIPSYLRIVNLHTKSVSTDWDAKAKQAVIEYYRKQEREDKPWTGQEVYFKDGWIRFQVPSKKAMRLADFVDEYL